MRTINGQAATTVTNFPATQTVDGSVGVTALPTFSATAYESITVDNTAGGLTAVTYGDAVQALITVESHPMRYRLDGTDPTDTEGHLVDDGDTIVLTSAADIAGFSAIRTTGDSATIRVTYYE